MIATPHSPEHSHGERWTLRNGLDTEHQRFAHLIRPVVTSLKLYLVALGGTALVQTGSKQPATDLVEWAIHTRRRLRDQQFAGTVGVTATETNKGLLEIEEWARSIEATGGLVSATIAAGLLDAYQRIRSTAGTVWHSEMVPEGRTDQMEAPIG
jgi:hypothetical protein